MARSSPTPVSGGGTWTTLPTHGYMALTSFACAIRSNQTMACWVRGSWAHLHENMHRFLQENGLRPCAGGREIRVA